MRFFARRSGPRGPKGPKTTKNAAAQDHKRRIQQLMAARICVAMCGPKEASKRPKEVVAPPSGMGKRAAIGISVGAASLAGAAGLGAWALRRRPLPVWLKRYVGAKAQVKEVQAAALGE